MRSFLAVVILLTMSCFANGQCVGSSGFSSGFPSSGFYPSRNVFGGYSGSFYGGVSSRYVRPYSTKPYRPSYVNPYVRPNYNRPPNYNQPVSYTHLTLPTICSV